MGILGLDQRRIGPRVWGRLRRLDWFEERVGAPLLDGNHVEVLAGGRAAFAAVLAAVEAARCSVAVEMYTWADDRVGRRFAEALRRRARKGLPVCVLVDAFGSLGSEDLIASLADAGARVVWFHPLAPWTPRWYPNRRNHRKLVLIDGTTAVVGGINFAECYSAEFLGEQAWRDLMIRVHGPAAREAARMFVATWLRAGGALDTVAPLIVSPPPGGTARVQVVGGRGLRGRRTLLRSYRTLVAQARERIFLANAYFAPEGGLRRDLCAAARRGVRVDLLLAGQTDVPWVRWAGRRTYERLLDAGVRIREMSRAVLHAKVAVFDGQVLLAGSANLDYRSFRHNLELAVNVFDTSAAGDVLEAFEGEFRLATPIDRESWKRRPWQDRILERSAWAIRYWL